MSNKTFEVLLIIVGALAVLVLFLCSVAMLGFYVFDRF